MIEKITSEQISVNRQHNLKTVGDQFILDEKNVGSDKPELSGEITSRDRLDKLDISPEYYAVKNLSATAASLSNQVTSLNQEKLQGIRQKIQDGFYLSKEVLTVTADQLLSSEFKF